jgi:hypothetical protein
LYYQLLHIVGGSEWLLTLKIYKGLLITFVAVAPNSGVLAIEDGPNKDTYGYQKCVKINFDVSIGDPITVADCIMIAAKGK